MKKRQSPFLVKFAILTLITSFVWISFDVYRAFTERPAPSVSAEILAPVDPTLDTGLLDKLTNRVYFVEGQ